METLPQIGAHGTWVLDSPYVLQANTSYVCSGISKISTMVSDGVNVFTKYYAVNGVDHADYLLDLNAGVHMVGLTLIGGGAAVYVPSNKITTIPMLGEVAYSRLILSVDMGPLPDDLSLETAKQAISDHLSDVVGNASDIKIHRIGIKGQITYEQHGLLELNRTAAIIHRNTPYAELVRLTDIISNQSARITILEEALVSLQP